ncbi:MAG: hypothetical protein QUU85_02700, partial [Candidatus Eisenbacteria bacterium]|nr:hypothetical protein [Candidatus Eisenbacteria bacterium]
MKPGPPNAFLGGPGSHMKIIRKDPEERIQKILKDRSGRGGGGSACRYRVTMSFRCLLYTSPSP